MLKTGGAGNDFEEGLERRVPGPQGGRCGDTRTPRVRSALPGRSMLNAQMRSECLGALGFLEAGSLATQATQIEELGAANTGRTDLFYLVHNLGVVGEDALDALAEAHFADSETALRTLFGGDHDALKSLEALFFTF